MKTRRMFVSSSSSPRPTTIAVLVTVTFFCLVSGGTVQATEPGYGPWIHKAIEENPELKTLIEAYDSPLFIPAADFRTDGLYPEAQSYSLSGYWKGDGLGGVYLMAPVWLPDHAVINAVWLFAVDDDDDVCSTENITMWLQRVDNYTGAVDEMSTLSTTGASSAMQMKYDYSPEHILIEYPDYSYWLTARICSLDHEFYGAMIFYN